MASVTIRKILSGEMHAGRTIRLLLGLLAAVIGILIALVPLVDVLKAKIISRGLIRDEFAIGNLQASGEWTGFEPVIGILFVMVFFLALWYFSASPRRAVITVFSSSVFLVFFTMTLITPRIEAYSQRAAIEFYKSVAWEDAYITTLGFKSYAHLFYGEVPPPKNTSVYEKNWFLNGDIDKRTYIVFKVNRKERYLKEYPRLTVIYEKNGFVFAKREPG